MADKFTVTLDETAYWRQDYTRVELAEIMGCLPEEVEQILDCKDPIACKCQGMRELLEEDIRNGNMELDAGEGLSYEDSDA